MSKAGHLTAATSTAEIVIRVCWSAAPRSSLHECVDNDGDWAGGRDSLLVHVLEHVYCHSVFIVPYQQILVPLYSHSMSTVHSEGGSVAVAGASISTTAIFRHVCHICGMD